MSTTDRSASQLFSKASRLDREDAANREQMTVAPHAHKLTILTATVFITGEMAGSGVLALPKAIEQTGWIGLFLLAFCAAAAGYAGILLGKCWIILEERFPHYKESCRDPYPSIGYEAFGKVGRYMVSASIDFTLFGVGVVFLLLASENIGELLSHVNVKISACYLMLIVGGVLIPVVWLGTPKDFWPAAVGATIATSVACILLMVTIGQSKVDDVQHSPQTFGTFSLAFGTILFSFGGAPAFPTIQSDMQHPPNFSKAVVWGFLGLVLMYFPVAAIGYFAYGKVVEDNILQSLPSGGLLYAVEILITAHLIFAFVIVLNPLCQEFEKWFHIPTNFTWKRVVNRTIIVILVIFVAESLPHFGAILSLIGGSTNTLLAFVLPCVFYLKLCSLATPDDPKRYVPLHEMALCAEIIAVGVIGGIAATYYAIVSLSSPDTFVPPCYMNVSVLL